MLKRLMWAGQEEKGSRWILRILKNPYASIVLLLCLINLTLIFVNAGLWIMAGRQNLFKAADFTAFYTGSYLIRIGNYDHLYDWDTQAAYQRLFVRDYEFVGGLLPYINPPHVAVVLSPLTLFSLEVAFYLWTSIQFALLVWLLITLNRLFVDWSVIERFLLMTSTLAYWPLALNFLFGQFSLLLLLSFVKVYISLKTYKLDRAALWMLLLSVKPHHLLIPSMLLTSKRYWRMTILLGCTGIAIIIITGLIIGIKPWLEYMGYIGNLDDYYQKYVAYPQIEYTIRGILTGIFPEVAANTINIASLLFFITGMVVIGYLWRTNSAVMSSNLPLYFALTVLLSLFLSLHLNPYDSLILILPEALLYDYLRRNNFPRKILSIIILSSPAIFFISAFSRITVLGEIRPPIILMVTLLAWLIWYMIKERREHQYNKTKPVLPSP